MSSFLYSEDILCPRSQTLWYDTRSYHFKVTSAQDTHHLLNPDVLVGEVHHHSLCLKVPHYQKIYYGTS